MNFIELAHAASETQEPSALGFLLPIFILEYKVIKLY